MLRYLFRRLCYSLLVLWGVATLVFFLFNTLPGNTARLTSAGATRPSPRPDNPLWPRYGLYLNDLSPIGITSSKGTAPVSSVVRIIRLADSNYLSFKAPYLGRSYRTSRAVNTVLGEALPGTLMLALTAMVIATLLGTALGILAASKKGTAWDRGAVAASLAGLSIPSFFAALFIAYISGYHPGVRNLMLPAIALCIRPMAIIAQLTRSTVLDVLSQDYIRTAYAKGLTKARVVMRHVLPNTLNPPLAAASGWLAELIGGAFFVEYIFGRQGIGKTTVDALTTFDFPLLTGAVLLTALIFIVVNLLTDLLCAAIDPQMRL